MISTKDLKDLFGESSPDRVILKAQRLAARGRNDQALDVIKDAINRLGEVADLRVELATLHLSGGRPREAAESLRALLKVDPKQVQRVEEFVGWARTQFSDIEPLYEPMAEGHIARRNYTAAVDCLERINKKTLEAGLEGRLANLNRFLEKGTMVPKSALPTLYFAALAHEVIGDWHKTLEVYRKILAAAPADLPAVDERLKGLVGRNYKNTPLRLAYAEILESMGQRNRAWDEHLKALEVDPRSAPQVGRFIASLLQAEPENPDLLWASVRVRLAEGRIEEALELCGSLAGRGSHLSDIEKLLEELASTGKESVDTLLLLAKVAVAQGKVGRALAAIGSAIGNDARERGISALEQVVAAFPSEARAYQMLADCHLKEGRIDRSLQAYQELRRMDPASAPLISNRLRGLLAADPGNEAAQQLMEQVCIEAGDLQEAVPFLRRRLRRGGADAREALDRVRQMLLATPADPSLRRAAAEACLVLEDPAGAWGYLQDLIQGQGPAGPELLHLLVLCAGSSAELFRRILSHTSSLPPRWMKQPEVVFALAESAGRAGLFREAVQAYRQAELLLPEGAPICHEAIRVLGARAREMGSVQDAAILAEALLDAGDVEAATETLRGAEEIPAAIASRLAGKLTEALRRDPGNLALSAGLAGVYLASGQVARALSITRAAIADREDAASAPLTMIYGDALGRSGRQAEATRAYAASVKRDPSLAPRIIERLQQVIQVDMGIEAAHLILGRLLINEGRVADGVRALMSAWSVKADLAPHVLKDLDQTARRHPSEPSVDMARAQLLMAAGEPVAAATLLGARCRDAEPGALDEIVARLEGITANRPDCARAQLELGRAYLGKRWAARACACLLRAYEQDRSLAESIALPLAQIQKEFPDEPEAHIARGALYAGEGRVIPAAEAYLKAVSLPGSGASEGIARLTKLSQSGRDVPPEVQLMLARACRLSGDIPGCVAAATRALQAGGDHAVQVRAEMDSLVAKHPASAPARLGRATALTRVLDLEAAARDLGDALRYDPSCAVRVAGLAREILDRRPSLTAGVTVLANALGACGDDAGAARALDDAIASQEHRDDVDLLLARRALALKAGDAALARSMLTRAEGACPDRDRLLERLHRDAMTSPGGPSAASALRPEATEAVERGDYFRAAEIMTPEPATPIKAWLLERCGRHAEAAACLQELLGDDRAAARFTSLYNDLVARELEGRAPALMAETRCRFEIEPRQTETIQGGVR
ncbi:MAG TPA: tetratricopeptide repeat protein [Candidatus Polarisedimenticolia bacterium]|jgi:tetratricopeptide (TPR) repeat protein